ncbi:hypothetical protein M3Y97_00121400 [Aphelenchoides bicaudatus]|nr:hypothetical protein M3Y97_00121400 [Aphelenchoides bicaudatus]
MHLVSVPQDPYTIEVARNFEDSNNIQQPAVDQSPSKNGARPSFRQYNTGTSYQQQYGVYSANGQQQQSGQYTPYDNSQQYGQRYPQYNNDGNQNGFQRDPRFNGAQSIGTSAALCSAAFLTLMRVVFN